MKAKKIFLGVLLAVSTPFLFSSCGDTETNKEEESQPDGIEEVESTVLTPLERLHRVSLDANGNVVIETIQDGSIANKNVHVITHGWAPGYKHAVDAYAEAHPGETLMAWDPDAIVDGQRFFVGSFFPLAKAILEADRGSSVLVFSWIDISATSTDWEGFLDGKDYDEFCAVEAQTTNVGQMLRDAIDAALKPDMKHQLHLLGHSFGTRVVSVGGVELKKKGYLEKIHITLFDSPERAPVSCGDNRLYDVLPNFNPDRDRYFVDNYISYWDECMSTKSDVLNSIVDATIIPYGSGSSHIDSCQLMTYPNCASCKHSAGINWYTAATKDPLRSSGLWWSPLVVGSSVTKGLSQFYYKPSANPVRIDPASECKQDEIATCLPVP